MRLEKGDKLTAKDCHKRIIVGKITQFLEHTVIVKQDSDYYVVKKSELKEQGYTFPIFKKQKYFKTATDRKEE